MNNQERLDLKKLMDNSDYQDNTEYIRKVKHSVFIRDDIRRIENIKTKYSDMKLNNHEDYVQLCRNECEFLFNNYTDIFNKLVKDELDLLIMTKLLTVLKLIEDNKIDQNEGSVMIGKVLKELYIDSAMKRMDNLDKQNKIEEVKNIEPINISWREFKKREPTVPPYPLPF
jgi:hypothetical protein